jgi:hypothetical protein
MLTLLGITYAQVHGSLGFFRKRNTLTETSVTPVIYSVSDIIVTFTPALTPCPRSSVSYAQKFMFSFRNGTPLRKLLYRHTTYTPPTSPHPRSSRSRSLRSSGFFRVWPGLVPLASPLDPKLDFLLFLPEQPSVCETFRSLRFSV